MSDAVGLAHAPQHEVEQERFLEAHLVRGAGHAGSGVGMVHATIIGIFDPTVHVPLAVLNRVDDTSFSWQVPGLRAELVDGLVRTLPKRLRRGLTPLAEAVEQAVDELRVTQDRPLAEALAEVLTARAGERVTAADLDERALAPHQVAQGAQVLAERHHVVAVVGGDRHPQVGAR